MKDLTTGVTIYCADNPNIDNALVANESIVLVPGHSYEVKAMVFTTSSNPQLDAIINVSWVVGTSSPVIEQGGGLRIKEIKNYTDDNTLAIRESYEYPLATPLTPIYYINSNYAEVIYEIGFGLLGVCNPYYFKSGVCRVYHSGSVYPVSTVSGSPFMYTTVTKYNKDISGVNNGKTEYNYDIIRDQKYLLLTFLLSTCNWCQMIGETIS